MATPLFDFGRDHKLIGGVNGRCLLQDGYVFTTKGGYLGPSPKEWASLPPERIIAAAKEALEAKPESTEEKPKKRQRKWWRRILIIVAAILLCWIVLVAILKWRFPERYVIQKAVNYVKNNYNVNIL